MRLATFNVLHGRWLRSGRPVAVPDTVAAEAPLAEAVTSLDADVVALQELDRLQERSGRVDQAAVAAAAAGMRDWRYATALHGRSTPDRGWVLDPSEPGLRVHGTQGAAREGEVPSHGVALMTRLPVRKWRARRLAPAPLGLPLRVAGRPGLTPVRDQPRAAVAAVLEGRHGRLTVVALHLSFVPGWNVRQLLVVRDWIADLPQPHVLLGDFNLIGAIPGAVLNAAELMRPVHPCDWRALARRPTYPAHRPIVQFDHVLTHGRAAKVVGTARTPETAVSDHRPLVVDVSL